MQPYIDKIKNGFNYVTDKMNDALDAIENSVYEYFNNDGSIKIVILLCENNKIYVEATNNENAFVNYYFFQNNKTNEWPEWLQNNKPIKIYNVIRSDNVFDEDKFVFHMMCLKGIENVRGGSFKNQVLHDHEITVIEKIIGKHCSKFNTRNISDKNIVEKKRAVSGADINNHIEKSNSVPIKDSIIIAENSANINNHIEKSNSVPIKDSIIIAENSGISNRIEKSNRMTLKDSIIIDYYDN